MKRAKIIGAFFLATVSAAYAAPEPPAQVRANPGTDVIEIIWVRSPNDPVNVTGYEVTRAVFPSGPYLPVCVTLKGAVSCIDRRAQPDQMYYYRVRALGIGDDGHSPFTHEVSTILPRTATEENLWRKPPTPPVN